MHVSCSCLLFFLFFFLVYPLKSTPLTPTPSSREIRDLAPTDQCVSVCHVLRASESVCSLYGGEYWTRWHCGVCVFVHGGLSAPAAEQAVRLVPPPSPRAKKRKALDWRWGKARSSFKPQTSPLVTGCRLTATATATANCSSTSTSLHSSRTRLVYVRDPTWPNTPSTAPSATRQTCLGPSQTTDQVLRNQTAPCS